MKYTNKELIETSILKMRKFVFSYEELRLILVNCFKVGSLKYKNLAGDYMRYTIKSLEMDGLGTNNELQRKFECDLENGHIIDVVAKLKRILDKEKEGLA